MRHFVRLLVVLISYTFLAPPAPSQVPIERQLGAIARQFSNRPHPFFPPRPELSQTGELMELLKSSEGMDRVMVAHLLMRADPDGPGGSLALEELMPSLDADAFEERYLAATALAYYGLATPQIVDVLVASLGNQRGVVRHQAASSLMGLGDGASEAIQDLVDTIARADSAGDWALRSSAIDALREIVVRTPLIPEIEYPENPNAMRGEFLWMMSQEMQRGANPERASKLLWSYLLGTADLDRDTLRHQALWALYESTQTRAERDALRDRLEPFLFDWEYRNLWPSMMRILVEMGNLSPRAEERLLGLTRVSDPEIRAACAVVLLRYCPDNPQAQEAILKMDEDRFLRYRREIIGAMASEYIESERWQPVFKYLLTRQPVESHPILEALVETEEPPPGMVELLVDQAERPHRTEEELSLIAALSLTWEAEELLPLALEIAEHASSAEARRSALLTLADWGRSEAADILREGPRDPLPFARQEAKKALRRYIRVRGELGAGNGAQGAERADQRADQPGDQREAGSPSAPPQQLAAEPEPPGTHRTTRPPVAAP